MRCAAFSSAVLLVLLLASCSSSDDGSTLPEDHSTTALANHLDINTLRKELVDGGFECSAPEPGEGPEAGLPAFTDQVNCAYGSTSIQISLFGSASDVDTAEAAMNDLMACDPQYIPAVYVSGGEWLAFAGSDEPGASRRAQFDATTRASDRIVEVLGGTIATVNDCEFVD